MAPDHALSETSKCDVDLPRYVGRPVRRYRLEVEIIDTGNWRDIQAEVSEAVHEITPGGAYAVDLAEETLLVPDGREVAGSREGTGVLP